MGPPIPQRHIATHVELMRHSLVQLTLFHQMNTALQHILVQFSLFLHPTPSKEYFIRNTGTGNDGRSCHLSHCPI